MTFFRRHIGQTCNLGATFSLRSWNPVPDLVRPLPPCLVYLGHKLPWKLGVDSSEDGSRGDGGPERASGCPEPHSNLGIPDTPWFPLCSSPACYPSRVLALGYRDPELFVCLTPASRTLWRDHQVQWAERSK